MRLDRFLQIARPVLYENVAEQVAKLEQAFVKRGVETILKLNPHIPGIEPWPGAVDMIKHVYARLVEADPSQQKKYLTWIIRWYWSEVDRLVKDSKPNPNMFKTDELVRPAREDAPKVRAYLDVLNRGRIRGFDINSVKTLPDLYAVVQHLMDTPTQRSLSKKEKAEIDAETEFRYRGPEGMIVIPKTERASQFWGRGTEWCTAYTDPKTPCQFNDYNERGSLYIIMPNDAPVDSTGTKIKYQLHLGDNQLMTSSDAPVDPDWFQYTYPWVKDALNLSLADIDRTDTKNGQHTSWASVLHQYNFPENILNSLIVWASPAIQDWVVHNLPSLLLHTSIPKPQFAGTYLELLETGFRRALEVAKADPDGPEFSDALKLLDWIVNRMNEIGRMRRIVWSQYTEFYDKYVNGRHSRKTYSSYPDEN